MVKSLGWMLQVVGLILVGVALMLGMFYGRLRLEVAVMAIGGVLFLIGRQMQGETNG